MSASSWQGIVVSPGGAPTPPEGPADEAGRAGATPIQGPDFSGAGLRDLGPFLRSRLPLAPSIQRHRLTPLDEQGELCIVLR